MAVHELADKPKVRDQAITMKRANKVKKGRATHLDLPSSHVLEVSKLSNQSDQ